MSRPDGLMNKIERSCHNVGDSRLTTISRLETKHGEEKGAAAEVTTFLRRLVSTSEAKHRVNVHLTWLLNSQAGARRGWHAACGHPL